MKKSLQKIAGDIRLDILRMFYISGRGHLAPALSCVDILISLYLEPIINYDKRFSPERDRVILSKGHACAALYAVLAYAGFFEREKLWTFYQKGTLLGGHPNIQLSGVETATGSLGHGLCFGTGVAMAAKLDRGDYRTYVIIGDGESEEGSVWEAASFAGNKHLDNLTVIMDHNGLQGSDFIKEVAPIEPIEARWRDFGWNTLNADGHDYDSLKSVFAQSMECKGKPSIIIAKTTKGKGVKSIENNPAWHSRAPKSTEWNVICEDLGLSLEDIKQS